MIQNAIQEEMSGIPPISDPLAGFESAKDDKPWFGECLIEEPLALDLKVWMRNW